MRRFITVVALAGTLMLSGFGAGAANAWDGRGSHGNRDHGNHYGRYENRHWDQHGGHRGGYQYHHPGYRGAYYGRPGITLYLGPTCGPSVGVPYYGYGYAW